MQQVKIFKSVENDLRTLEREINDWIRESSVKVISVTGNIAPQSGTHREVSEHPTPSDVLLIVLYQAS